ncbi:MAG: class I tRNA ligase family protein, partial [Candidatus Omnitrophica bacterium]|nr:class I tRNA ligase family protein [Candidatus Omnitrophota bacterium]
AAPPEAEFYWNERGMEGSWRFLNRVWNMVDALKQLKNYSDVKRENSLNSEELEFKLHLTIKKVTEEMQGGFKFNTAISAMMELTNEIATAFRAAEENKTITRTLEEAIETLVVLLAPIAPHFCEELWQMSGKNSSIINATWPACKVEKLQKENIEIVIQINSKVRSKITVPSSISDEDIKKAAFEDVKIKEWLKDKSVKKFFIIPKKMVNIIV